MSEARTIWKFEFDLTDEPVVQMPQGTQVLSVALVRRSLSTGIPAVLAAWAAVDPSAEPTPHRFVVCGTGHPLGAVGRHLGTLLDGPFVWHLFEDAEASR